MEKTYLHLINGQRFDGTAFGFAGESDGEVVFTTAMTGYPEGLTDPSFFGQILVFTYPMIGNYGVPKKCHRDDGVCANFESEKIWVKGVVVSDVCHTPSHYSYAETFSDWLAHEHIPGIAGIDTRRLTQLIRDEGCMRGKISSRESVTWEDAIVPHAVSSVSCDAPIVYRGKKGSPHILLLDCGVKHGILRSLVDRGYTVTRVPWNTDPMTIQGWDILMVSNGPGDPKDCPETIANIKKTLAAGKPYFGVCLGHQLLGLAIGGDTYKLPYGHRGINQPVQDVDTKKAYVTSQNHGYAVNPETLPNGYVPWFINLNDGTNEGIRHATKCIRSVQFHPEGNPGPTDTDWLFDELKNAK
jgi:carbamoyl-phosphate synthase large subunit/carbamoyl-phosphate synthase small subunit